MNKIYEEVKKRSGGKYDDLRFSEIVFGAQSATITVVCPADRLDEVRGESAALKTLLTDICGFNTAVALKIVADDRSDAAIAERTAAFMAKFPYLASAAKNVEVADGVIKIKMHKSMMALAHDDFLPRFEQYLANTYTAPIKVVTELIEFKAETIEEGKPAEQELVRPKEKIEYAPESIEPIVGGMPEAETAISAACVDGNNDDIAVCGILTMATDFMSKGAGAKRSRPYQKFLLYDGEYTLQCRFYPRDDFSVIESVPLNTPVCVVGNSALERGRTGETSLTVRTIASCKAKGLTVVPAPPVPEKYRTVKPVDYEEYVQASLFSNDDKLPPTLKGSFVAFDFETTGLSIFYDKPTEIGAVKIVDGVITETFSTLIDPRRPIPPEVVEKTGINDDMVKGKPLFENVLPDFYKFSYGCALIGHNIAFDFPFLVKYGNRYGYPFGDRRTFDTLGLAPIALPGIDNLTLNHVLELLGLVNDNAHRALSDATATAKAFIAMQKKIYSGNLG